MKIKNPVLWACCMVSAWLLGLAPVQPLCLASPFAGPSLAQQVMAQESPLPAVPSPAPQAIDRENPNPAGPPENTEAPPHKSLPPAKLPPTLWQQVQATAISTLSNIVGLAPLLIGSLQLTFLFLVVFGYLAHHFLKQRRLALDKSLYDENVDNEQNRCSCGLIQGSCDWCKKEGGRCSR